MRSAGLEPLDVVIQLAGEGSSPEGNESQQAKALGLHRSYEPLDDGDAPGPHRGTQRLEAAHEAGDELGKSADRIADLDERLRSLIVEPPVPRCHGQRGDEETPSGLGE